MHVLALTKEQISSELTCHFPKLKAKPRAAQLYQYLYRNEQPSQVRIDPEVLHSYESIFSFEEPLALQSFEVSPTDGAVKFVFRCHTDGSLIESVLVPERERLTLCISSQVGCRWGCRFCQTGSMGFKRNLATEELVGQLLLANKVRQYSELRDGVVGSYSSINNVVFMGMGEPLDNLDNVCNAIEVMTDSAGFNLSHNKITVSTAGILPQMSLFLKRSLAGLALSLHSPFDEERSRMMPVNKVHPIADVLATLSSGLLGKRSVFIQYVLVRGENDSQAHAAALVDLLRGIPAKVNLIPLNEHERTEMRRPELITLETFRKELRSHGIVTTLRMSKGRDILAACGQLVQK